MSTVRAGGGTSTASSTRASPARRADSFAARLSSWAPPPGCVGIVGLGQAGFALVSGDDRVLVDPFLSPRPDRVAEPVADAAELPGVTLVLATHEHEDHLDLPTWRLLARSSPAARFIVAEPLVALVVAAGIDPGAVIGARVGAEIVVGTVRVTPVPACHAVEMDEGYSLGGRVPRFVGYVVDVGGVRIYHAGDTLAHERIVRAVAEHHPDIALLPINGRDAERERLGIVGNLSPDEAAEMARDIGVVTAVPMHFDGIRGNEGAPGEFVRAMRHVSPGASVWVPAPGATLVWPAGGVPSRADPR